MDILSPEVKFNFKGNSSFQTFIGGVLSLIIMILVLSITILWMIPVINFENPQISLSKTLQNDLFLNLSKTNYPFAFSIVSTNGEILSNPDLYFDVNAGVHQIDGLNQIFSLLSIERCNYSLLNSSFGDMSESFKDVLIPGVISSSYCLSSKQKNFFVNSTIGSVYSNLIYIQFSYCNNQTMNNRCKPVEKIQDIINNYYFYIISTDISIDHKKIKPAQKIVQYKPYMLSSSLTRTQYINYKKVFYISDFNYFYSENSEEVYYQIDSTVTDFQLIGNGKSLFLNIYITMDNQVSDQYYRSYVKVPQILAQISSILSIIIFISGISMEKFFVRISHQSLFDTIFTKENHEKFNYDNISETQKSNIQIATLNNFLAQNEGKASDIKVLENSIKKNSDNFLSFIEFWSEYKNEVSEIIKVADKRYFANLFPCNRMNIISQKLDLSDKIFKMFFDSNFIFTNLIQLIYFRDNLTKKNN